MSVAGMLSSRRVYAIRAPARPEPIIVIGMLGGRVGVEGGV